MLLASLEMDKMPASMKMTDMPASMAGTRPGSTNPPLVANARFVNGKKGDLAASTKKSSAILSKEEVAALVGRDQQEPQPRCGHLHTVLLGLLIAVLVFTVVFLWYTKKPVQPKQSPAPDQEMAQARIALDGSHYVQALASLGRAAVLGGTSHLDSVNRLRAEVLLARAASMIDEQPETALLDINSAMNLAPQWPQVLLQAGRLLIRSERYEPALEAYLRVLRINSRLDVGWFNLGYIYLKTERYEQGIEAFHRTIELNSALAADAYVNLAICQLRLEREQEAVDSLRQALSVNPNHQTARDYLAKLLGGEPGP